MTTAIPQETNGGSGSSSTGHLIQQASEQISRLVRDELALARIEMTTKGKRLGGSVGLAAAAAIVALYGLAAALLAAGLGLAQVMAGWLAALVIAVALLLVAGGLALSARATLRRATPLVPRETVRSVKTDIEELKARAHR